MSVASRHDAPKLPGLEFIDVIGSGGYSEVYLYEQRRPRRPVAVKVLDVASLSAGAIDDYSEEANVMAMVSAHPFIVQVFNADVSPSGQPYFVMEYYSGLNYLQRSRQERIEVAEVLRVGIQIASAVEVAHRAGIQHRDIKPANVLTNEYRKPGLTDFGIAAVEGLNTGSERDGLSIPWSSPEAITDGAVDRRSDIYSLAATLYTMLAGRAPFEEPGGDNRTLAMMNRIHRCEVRPTGRDDVPAALERLLAGAMAKQPANRPQTALEFAQQLQHIESGLQLALTPLELPASPEQARRGTDDDDATVAKPAQPFQHLPPTPGRVDDVDVRSIAAAQPQPPANDAWEDTNGLGAHAAFDTVGRADLGASPAPLPTPSARSRRPVVAALVALAVLATVVVVGFAVGRDTPRASDADDPVVNNDRVGANDNIAPAPPVGVSPPAIERITATEVKGADNVYRWDEIAGARYQVQIDGAADTEIISTNRFSTYAPCITVRVVAPNQMMSAPTTGCIPNSRTTDA